MFHDETRAKLEERLTVALPQLVENLASGGVGQGFEHITHAHSICK